MSNRPPRTGIIRQTLLYGAAFGLLLGLAIVAMIGFQGHEAIALWRNTILAGAAIGFLLGLIFAFRNRDYRRTFPNDDSHRQAGLPESHRPHPTNETLAP